MLFGNAPHRPVVFAGGTISSPASRRRSRRHRLTAAAALAAVVSGAAFFATREADASWVAQLTKVTAQVNEAIDIWEKHTSTVTDKMDELLGKAQPFTNLHAGVRELMDWRGLRNVTELGQLYRAQVRNPECYTPTAVSSGSCQHVADFVPTEIRDIGSQTNGILYDAHQIGYNYSDAEWILRQGVGAAREYVANMPPEMAQSGFNKHLSDMITASDEIIRTNGRIQANIHRAYWDVRRYTSLASSYRHYGNQVFRPTNEVGGFGALTSFEHWKSGKRASDLDATRTGGGAEDMPCHAGDNSRSLVTGTAATRPGSGPTLLAQFMEADCAGATDASGKAHGDGVDGAHRSPAEEASLQVSAGILEANMLAAQVEQLAMELASEIEGARTVEESRRRRLARYGSILDCPNAPAYHRGGCQGVLTGPDAEPANLAAEQRRTWLADQSLDDIRRRIMSRS